MVELGKGLENVAVGPGSRLIAGADGPRVRIEEPATGYRGLSISADLSLS